ncbi:antiviral reverse transcriptase Drt3b [Chryseobacterium mucoviscidosis]|uniref:Reverse transcriptase domain-containing protein n=1 Tax=Chryseobacterium mucoviscidosis TaxID=1945581 RepID=A0A202BWT6_9FLAO|nr:antiviral reverse transcriptase Drt3b [Chryseobacterium mucoviscidosis]OVE55958.1 hypothetical protein B0E34_17260 [Chryseobacterium mucoviscidosis]
MSRKKRYIQYPKERAILSDVHPYEVPITFSNRYFYRFLVEYNVFVQGNKIEFKNNLSGNDLDAFKEILKIIFHHDYQSPDNDNKFRKIPFCYRITHKEKDFRELALIHPINQVKLVKLYDDFKESILYSCSISDFSIRKPVDVARFSFFNDKLHQLNKGDKNDFLELKGKEYEDLKTFFSYKKYTNVYKFYEDYRYHRAEKKYNFLFKFDIARCFDSIYSHSISWAVLGLEAVKENIDSSKNNFSGVFDKFVQYCNYGETNGILIGPEFSRIFAEIILQKIDKTVEEIIKSKHGLINKIDYELYRYVDDYFLFCDDEVLKEDIFKIFKHELKSYKLSINNSKSLEYYKPIITEITIAKEKINQLFSENPKFSIIDLEKVPNIEEREQVEVLNHKFSFFFNANNLITQYKILIKESKVDYKDVLNYSLALLNTIIEKNLVNFESIYFQYKIKIKSGEIEDKNVINKLDKVEESFTSHIVSFIDFIFFIYSVSPRVNSTIKISHILSKILAFYKIKYKSDKKKFIISTNNRQRVFKKILDESSLIIKKNLISEYAQVETLYLLTVIKELDREFRIPEVLLERFIGFDQEKNKIPDCRLNYFSIVVILFYLGHSTKFEKIKNALKSYIVEYIKSFPIEKRNKSSELTHLILDLIACPYLEIKYKRKIFIVYKDSKTFKEVIESVRTLNKILDFQKSYVKYWFTKWERFNLAKELEYKKSQEVYS